ncbi:MAG: PadR family transcriptional regulator [Promethearchaeota archaeon]
MTKIFSTDRNGSLSGLEILVLKIINNNDGITGYDIIQKITTKPRGLWKGTAGSIYPLLKSLAEKKLVKIEKKIDGGRVKKEYSITEKGSTTLKDTLSNKIYPSMHSFMNSIFTLIGDIPRIKNDVETMFCSYPHHRSVLHVKIDEDDWSLENINRIKTHIETLEMTRDKLQNRITQLNNQIENSLSILKDIEEKRKNARVIDILDEDDYDKRMMNI